MNQALQARPCWSLLAQRAEDQLQLIRQEMTQAHHRLTQLESSRDRLQKMYDDYSSQFNQPGSQSQGMSHAVVLRQFMSQLLSLVERVANIRPKASQDIAVSSGSIPRWASSSTWSSMPS